MITKELKQRLVDPLPVGSKLVVSMIPVILFFPSYCRVGNFGHLPFRVDAR